MQTYIANAFSLAMVPESCVISVFPAHMPTVEHEILPACNSGEVISAVGHPDTANVLGVPCNHINITLKKGDVLYVAQLQGGRLPEGTTKLPEGFSFKWLKVTPE